MADKSAAVEKITTAQKGGAGCEGLFGSSVSVVNLITGAGILTTPYAFAVGGWVTIIIVVAFTTLFWFTAQLLIDCLNHIEEKSMIEEDVPRDFAYLGMAAFGTWGKTFISIAVAIELGMYAACFLVLVSVNLKGILSSVGIPSTVVVLCIGFLGFLLAFVPSGVLARISSIGVASLFVCVAAFAASALSMSERASGQARPIIGTLSGVVEAAGIICGCFGGAPCLPILYNQCAPKQCFGRALGYGYSIACMIYVGVGAFAFAFVGIHADQSLTENIARSLDGKTALIGFEWLRLLSMGAIAVKLMAMYPLVVAPVCTLFDTSKPSMQSRVLVRLFVCAIVTALAVFSSEYLAILSSIIGNSFTMLTSLLFPTACFLSLFWKIDAGWRKVCAVLIFGFGVIWGVYGTVSTIMSL